MDRWWRASLLINRALCGSASEPLCSRVYRQPPSIWRTGFIRATGLLFHEPRHCEDVHRRWSRLR